MDPKMSSEEAALVAQKGDLQQARTILDDLWPQSHLNISCTAFGVRASNSCPMDSR